jgi:inner membrane protein
MTIADIASHWLWIIAGVLLLGAEILVPGAFMLWLGVAAIGTGLLLLLVPLPFQAALVVFAVGALVSVFIGRMLARSRAAEPADAKHLHQRGQALVGETFFLVEPIIEGAGAVKVGDSTWRVTGPDMAAGVKVKAIAIDGATLKVEAA